jgi:hypothetical protein
MPFNIDVCFTAPGTLLGPRSDNCPINGASQFFIAPHAESTWSTRTSDFSGPIGGLFNSNGMRITPARVNADAREDLIVYGRSYGSFTKLPIPAGFHTP